MKVDLCARWLVALTVAASFYLLSPSSSTAYTDPILNTWVEVTPSNLSFSVTGWDKLVYAANIRKHLILANYKENGSEPNRAILGYDYATNTWSVQEYGSVFPTEYMPEGGHPDGLWVYDGTRGVILYQCCGSGSILGTDVFNWFWWYDPLGQAGREKHTAQTLPSGTPQEASAAYEAVNDVYILHGGAQGAGGAGTWKYLPSTNVWSQPSPSCVVACPANDLILHSMAARTADHKIYLFGGETDRSNGPALNDVYVYDPVANSWAKLSISGTPPIGRIEAGFAYDSLHDKFLVYGGLGATGLLNDTWVFDPAGLTWTQQSPTASPTGETNRPFERLSYDSDQNAFVLVTYTGFGSGATWVYRLSGTGPQPGEGSAVHSPSTGGFNRQSSAWAFEPQVADDGTNLYAVWIETGLNSDGSDSKYPNVYASSNGGSSASWANMGSAYNSINGSVSSNFQNYSPSIAYSSAALVSFSQQVSGTPGPMYSGTWGGSSWSGGLVNAGSVMRSRLIGIGGVPYAAFTVTGAVTVKSFSGTWSTVGSSFNRIAGGATAVSIASDGAHPWVAWTEYTAAAHAPQVFVSEWISGAWTAIGSSLNVSTSNYALDPSISWVSGQPYVCWVERSLSGNAKPTCKTWNGSTWAEVGASDLSRDTTNGWSWRPYTYTIGSDLYMAHTEQAGLGARVQTYVDKWNGSAWSAVGGSLNADPTLGSAQRVTLAKTGTAPVAVWSEVNDGAMRNVYAKKWNGSAWTALNGPLSSRPSAATSGAVKLSGKVH